MRLGDYHGVHVWAIIMGAIIAWPAIFISIWFIRQHLRYNHSLVAKYEIRILMMVPVYAFFSWLGLVRRDLVIYWDSVRELYDAVVIYAFYQFLVEYLGGEYYISQLLSQKHNTKQEILIKIQKSNNNS